MKEYLTEMISIIDQINNDPIRSLQFFTTSLINTNITNKPPDNCKMILVREILAHLIRNYTQLRDNNDLQKNLDDVLVNIDNKYQHNQHICWKSHEHHFHKSFEEYVNCPVTCLCEIGEFLDKVRKEYYDAARNEENIEKNAGLDMVPEVTDNEQFTGTLINDLEKIVDSRLDKHGIK